MVHTIEEFMETVPSKNVRTRAHYEEVLKALEAWAGCGLGELTENRLAALMKRLRGMKSGRHYAGLLRMFLDRFDMAGPDSVPLAKKARIAQRGKRLEPDDILTVREAEAVIKSAGPQRDRAFIATLYETGARVSEVCSLKWEDIKEKPANGGPAYYVIRFWNVKVPGEEHLAYIINAYPVMEQWLKQHPDPRDGVPLFPSAIGGHPLTRKGGWAIVAAATKHAKIEKHVHPHTFRHSRATHLLRANVSPAKVCLLMGWVQGTTQLSRYSHLVGEDAKDAAFHAAGYEAPDAVPVDVLDFSDERLRDAVPVLAFPEVPGGPRDGWAYNKERNQWETVFTPRERALMEAVRSSMLEGATKEQLRYAADMMEARERGEDFPTGDRAMKLAEPRRPKKKAEAPGK